MVKKAVYCLLIHQMYSFVIYSILLFLLVPHVDYVLTSVLWSYCGDGINITTHLEWLSGISQEVYDVQFCNDHNAGSTLLVLLSTLGPISCSITHRANKEWRANSSKTDSLFVTNCGYNAKCTPLTAWVIELLQLFQKMEISLHLEHTVSAISRMKRNALSPLHGHEFSLHFSALSNLFKPVTEECVTPFFSIQIENRWSFNLSMKWNCLRFTLRWCLNGGT